MEKFRYKIQDRSKATRWKKSVLNIKPFSINRFVEFGARSMVASFNKWHLFWHSFVERCQKKMGPLVKSIHWNCLMYSIHRLISSNFVKSILLLCVLNHCNKHKYHYTDSPFICLLFMNVTEWGGRFLAHFEFQRD